MNIWSRYRNMQLVEVFFWFLDMLYKKTQENALSYDSDVFLKI